MKVILLDDVAKVGRRGEVRDVSDGFARNFLIPTKLPRAAAGRPSRSLPSQDIVDFLDKHGVKVERRRVHLDEPIKTLGETSVTIRLHQDVTAQFKVSVVRIA